MFDGLAISENLAECKAQGDRSKNFIETMPTAIRVYLMELFWTQYNNVQHVVHRESFEEEHSRPETHFYTPFLHICMMAMGCKSSDTKGAGINLAVLQDVEEGLEKEAKAIADCGLGARREIPNVQALLVLSDLEYGLGRENMGWMYGGEFIIYLYSRFRSCCLLQFILAVCNRADSRTTSSFCCIPLLDPHR